MLRVEHLQPGTLPPLTFEVAAGECLAIEGPSGAGKTLLLRAIADLDPAPGPGVPQRRGAQRDAGLRSGAATCATAQPSPRGGRTRRARRSRKLPPGRVDRLLHSLGLEPQVLDRALSALSTGERQRLALARALTDEPPLLLLDEPTGALDPQSAALVEELIKYQMLSGRSAILVSHDRGQIERLAHARLLLSKPAAAGASRTVVAVP